MSTLPRGLGVCRLSCNAMRHWLDSSVLKLTAPGAGKGPGSYSGGSELPRVRAAQTRHQRRRQVWGAAAGVCSLGVKVRPQGLNRDTAAGRWSEAYGRGLAGGRADKADGAPAPSSADWPVPGTHGGIFGVGWGCVLAPCPQANRPRAARPTRGPACHAWYHQSR